MESIKEHLKQREISQSTVLLYVKKLEMLHDGLGIKNNWEDFSFLMDTDRTIAWINQFNSAKRRTLLNAAMVGLSPASKKNIPVEVEKEYDIYRKTMMKEGKTVSDNKITQQKSVKEDLNWTTIKDLNRVLKTYANALKIKGFNIKNPPTKNTDINILQKLLVGSLYLLQPPRRLEYGIMKTINEKEYSNLDTSILENNNYIVTKSKFKMFFSFGKTKVKRKPDERVQKIDLNKNLVKLVRFWFATINLLPKPNGIENSFLITRELKPQSANGLSKFLINNVFEPTGKLVGASMVRKIYLSEKYKDDTPLLEKMKVAELMNHSASCGEMHYVKKN